MGFAWQKPYKGDKQNMLARGSGVWGEGRAGWAHVEMPQGKVRMGQGGKGQAQSWGGSEGS